MSDDEKITMSKSEYNQAIELAVQKQRVDTIAEILQNHEHKEDKYLKEIFDKMRGVEEHISKWPLKMSQCRDDLEKDISNNFIGKIAFNAEVKRLEGKIDDQWKRITLAVVVASAAIQFSFKLWGG